VHSAQQEQLRWLSQGGPRGKAPGHARGSFLELETAIDNVPSARAASPGNRAFLKHLAMRMTFATRGERVHLQVDSSMLVRHRHTGC